MQPAYLPFNEGSRLEALRELHILDSGPDPQCDALLALVAETFDVPIAALALIDEDRQWDKAMLGLPARFQQTPRTASLAAHVILSPTETMVVEDASLDPRFKASPLVSGPPFIRFYAGHAVLDQNRNAVGVLEIIDHSPRSMSAEAAVQLAHFAVHASALVRTYKLSYDLQQQAERDPMTGFGNRAGFNRAIDQAVAEARAGAGLSLVALDLDGFTKLNDVYGHVCGDAVLREAGRRVASALRPGDTPFRMGSDEFALLMKGPFAPGEPDATAQRVESAFAPPFTVDDHSLPVTVSIGIAVYGDQADTPAMMWQQALRTLDDAKRSGPGQIRTALDAEGDLRSDRRMEQDLREAIESESFLVYWQPIVDLKREALHSYEALARWNRPEHGLVSPHTFIQVAERGDLMIAIDKVILKKACRAAAAWDDPTGVSVNVSPEWFGTGQLPDVVEAALQDARLDPARLRLEITEGSLIKDFGRALKEIHRLKALGIQVTLDDFGFGMSSLSYLTEFPFDIIKLDGSFGRQLRENPRAAAVAEAAIELGHKLGIKVCAEGVEELWHLDFLNEHGCDLAQGYLFGRPSPVPQAPGRGIGSKPGAKGAIAA